MSKVAYFAVCLLLLGLQLASAFRTPVVLADLAQDTAVVDQSKDCPCAVCKKPDSIRLGGWDDKEFCHWSERHKYFWCRPQKGCECARLWAHCGVGTAHYAQLLAKVRNAPADADPCKFNDFTDLGRDFLRMVRHDKRYPSSDEYAEELRRMHALVEACELREPYSRALELTRQDEHLLAETNAFLSKPLVSSSSKAFAAEVCRRRFAGYYQQVLPSSSDGSMGHWASDDPCEQIKKVDRGSESAIVQKARDVCNTRAGTNNELVQILQHASPEPKVFNAMFKSLATIQSVMIQDNALHNRYVHYGCTYAMDKAETWDEKLRQAAAI